MLVHLMHVAIEICLLASAFHVPNKTKTVTLRILRTFTLEMVVQRNKIFHHIFHWLYSLLGPWPLIFQFHDNFYRR
jgi:hypothetical protein